MQFVLFGVNISVGLGYLVLKLLIAALLCAPGPFLHDNPNLLDTVVCIVPAWRQQEKGDECFRCLFEYISSGMC